MTPLSGNSFNSNNFLEQFVTHISVEDLDSGSNGEVTCELVNGTSDFYLELVYTNEYRLMSNKKFDRETQAR